MLSFSLCEGFKSMEKVIQRKVKQGDIIATSSGEVLETYQKNQLVFTLQSLSSQATVSTVVKVEPKDFQ